MDEKKEFSDLKKSMATVIDILDRIAEENNWWTVVTKGQATPEPLKAGDWCISIGGNVQYVIGGDARILSTVDTKGIEHDISFTHLAPHELTEKDLPDGWEYTHNHPNDHITSLHSGSKILMCIYRKTQHDAISEALKLHILRNSELGEQLFNEVE